MFPRAGEVAAHEIVVSMRVVVWIEHVRPDTDLGVRRVTADGGGLLGDALAEQLGHVATGAGLAGAAHANFVRAQQHASRVQPVTEQLRFVIENFIQLRLGHASRHLRVVN